ncbi:MAG TPA: hypothetical protein VJ302_32720 [Blastocatellia bacterium]|nr:hypothetical protein [Blastocatellia bacterium]
MRRPNFISSMVLFAAGFVLSLVVDAKSLALLVKGQPSPQIVREADARLAQKPAALQYWEYRVVTKTGKNDLERELTQLGEQGFEVFSVNQNRMNDAQVHLTILLRRLKYSR